jgi:ABC-2 type transport system ATP-binding protein
VPVSPLVSVAGLTKAFSRRAAVRDVSFELTPGVTGLLGPNGAGKSTLVRCLAGLCGWDEGEVRVAGIDPTWHAAEARRRIGYMPERVSFPPEMRVQDYLHFAAEVKGLARRERPAAVDTALGRAGLEHVRKRIISNLSKGYRQRVGLAQALMGDPPIVILDEPSAGLDPLNVIDIRDVLRAYAAKERVVLISTHVLPETRQLCDRVLVMSQGQVVYDGPTAGMATAGRAGYRAQVRLRPNGSKDTSPIVDEPGTTLVESYTRDGEHVLIVETEGDLPLGRLVGRLSGAGWLVVGVEPVADALEDAFRAAVLGTPE